MDGWQLTMIFAIWLARISTADEQNSQAVTDDKLIPLEEARDVLLRSCTPMLQPDELLCIWTDSNGRTIISDDKGNEWSNRSDWWRTAQHTPLDIAAGINFADRKILAVPLAEPAAESTQDDTLGFPIFILSSPERQDRTLHTEALLRAVGFTGIISFLPFTDKESVDLNELELSGVIHRSCVERLNSTVWIGEEAINSYVSNAIDHLRAVQAGLDAGFKLFGVFEDDLMLAGDPVTVRERISKALRSTPPSADMLYLEACYDYCSSHRFSDKHPHWARTTRPSCSAAILFTNKGARRIARLCQPIFWGIDLMYPATIRSKLVEAYVIIPHAFFQDGFWGSATQDLRKIKGRKRGDRAVPGMTHRPFSALCNEIKTSLNLAIVQVSLETPFLRQLLPPPNHRQSREWGKVVILFDLLIENPRPNAAETRVIYITDAIDGAYVEVGRWPDGLGYHGAILLLDPRSACFYTIDSLSCMLLVQTTDGEWNPITAVKVDMSRLLPFRRDIRQAKDVLITSFPIAERRSHVRSESDESFSEGMLRRQLRNTEAGPHHSSMVNGASPSATPWSSLLTGVHFIFDGIMYKLESGKMSGVSKMWYNIVPFMADAVQSMNGTFTHCQSPWIQNGRLRRIDIPGVPSLPDCDNLTEAVSGLSGDQKIVFSSYFRIASPALNDKVCNILPLYDFIPERMGVNNSQHAAFYAKSASILAANGFLSPSVSTTKDLLELHGIPSDFVSTSPIRAAPIFKRVPDLVDYMLSNSYDGDSALTRLLLSQKKFLLLMGYFPHSPSHMGYDLFWDALQEMPLSFKSDFAVHIVGAPPEHPINNVDISVSSEVREDVLPVLYSRASVLVYPSRYEGFGMVPIEAAACGCPLILGSFFRHTMQHVYGDDALYAGSVYEMMVALDKVARGEVPDPEKLSIRALGYGRDPLHGWNEAAKHYLEYMLTGPFCHIDGTDCITLGPMSQHDVELQTTRTGLVVRPLNDKAAAGYSSSR